MYQANNDTICVSLFAENLLDAYAILLNSDDNIILENSKLYYDCASIKKLINVVELPIKKGICN